jgi:hypothetical protein
MVNRLPRARQGFDQPVVCAEALKRFALPASRRTSDVVVCRFRPQRRSCWRRGCPQARDQRQDFCEHLLRHRDLGHLEGLRSGHGC